MNLHFLYGSETGTAEFLCDDLVDAAEGCDTTITSLADIRPADLVAGDLGAGDLGAGDLGAGDLGAGDLDTSPLYVIVSSTYGSGEPPTNAVDFYDALVRDKPDLSTVRFAIFGLGDRTFDLTFNHGPEKIMQALLDCGATMVGTRGIYDASSLALPEDVALPWLQEILQAASATATT